jgi:hypothetical protein
VPSHAINSATVGGHPAIMADMEKVEVIVAHHERATLRVGDAFTAGRKQRIPMQG